MTQLLTNAFSITLKNTNTATDSQINWQTADIGAVGTTGTFVSNTSGVFVGGAGSDIWGTADSFRFGYTTLTGDGYIIGRISGLTQATGTISPWAKAGLMMRDNISASSPWVHLLTTPSATNGISWQYRLLAGQNAAPSSSGQPSRFATMPPGQFYKIVRTGNKFEGFISPDQSLWTSVGNTTFSTPMQQTILVGVAVTSQSTTTLANGVFNQLSVTPVAGSVDVTPPTVPTISIANTQSNSVGVKWTNSIDSESGLSQYQLFRNNVQVGGAITANSYNDTGLIPSTLYSYVVRAVDAAGNISANSTVVSNTTSANLGVWSTLPAMSFVEGTASNTVNTSLLSYYTPPPGYKVDYFYDGVNNGRPAGVTVEFANTTGGSTGNTVFRGVYDGSPIGGTNPSVDNTVVPIISLI